MDDYADGMRLKNTLSHEVHVTQTSRGVTKLRAPSAVLTGCATCACRCSLYLLLMWFVSCLSSSLILLFMLEVHSFRSQFSVVGDVLFTPPSVTVNCVSCYRIDHCNFAPNSL